MLSGSEKGGNWDWATVYQGRGGEERGGTDAGWEPQVSTPALHTLSVMAQAQIPSTQEVETGGSDV